MIFHRTPRNLKELNWNLGLTKRAKSPPFRGNPELLRKIWLRDFYYPTDFMIWADFSKNTPHKIFVFWKDGDGYLAAQASLPSAFPVFKFRMGRLSPPAEKGDGTPAVLSPYPDYFLVMPFDNSEVLALSATPVLGFEEGLPQTQKAYSLKGIQGASASLLDESGETVQGVELYPLGAFESTYLLRPRGAWMLLWGDAAGIPRAWENSTTPNLTGVGENRASHGLSERPAPEHNLKYKRFLLPASGQLCAVSGDMHILWRHPQISCPMAGLLEQFTRGILFPSELLDI